jgi:2,3-bisphosphoglycerate-independent phosphoglycerate mutase
MNGAAAAAVTVPAACLVVLDGWGLAEPGPGNAVSLAQTPVFDELWGSYPHTELRACGEAVGLPDGQMGNSEVGHLNLGAGAVVRQDLVRIDDAVASRALDSNPVIRQALTCAPRVHLLGLTSDGGVHSSLEHLHALIDLAAGLGVRELFVHCFTDGRDTPPHAGAGYVEEVESWCRAVRPDGSCRVASVIGRYFAMDRDRRWDRTQLAYDLMVHGSAPHLAQSAIAAVKEAYAREETDEFIAATLVQAPTGSDAAAADAAPGHDGRVGARDSVLCFNFRPDRMRQIVRALAEPGFGDGDEELPGWRGRGGAGPIAHLATLTEYEEDWTYPVAFPPERPDVTLASVLALSGARQLHVAETEKYAHVTYFFNGGEEAPYAQERRELVPSPRDVPTYDHRPEMSARAAASAFVKGWQTDRPRFGIINFANPDMVGHTGVIPAAVRAVEAVDECLGEVVRTVLDSGGACLVTADHGNADNMLEPDGSPNTAHSLNPVPLIVAIPESLRRGRAIALRDGGILADVAPTLLALLGVPQPSAMSGRSLLGA